MKLKEGTESEYAQYVANNSDGYGAACVKAGEAVMRLLEDGKTPEEAEKGLYGHDLTGYMAGAAMSGVCHFSPRGAEMKAWWNRNTSGTPDEATGVNNPAILTLKD